MSVHLQAKRITTHVLREMKEKGEKPDVITYAGNGEPTLHPEFHDIIDDSIVFDNCVVVY